MFKDESAGRCRRNNPFIDNSACLRAPEETETEPKSGVLLITPNSVLVMEDPHDDWKILTFKVSARHGAAREVRHQVMELARRLPFTVSDLESIETAVGEAALNAARHGSPLGDRNHLHIHCERCSGQFIVEITDEGNGFVPETVPSPIAEDLKLNGYGLCLMNNLMDEVAYTQAASGGTTVRLAKRYAVVD